jgi:diguanylate cyclase (GGDEF)-like protein
MIDLDHFKSINDGFGHEMGDRMLVHFADLLRHSCRQEDLPARTGGEEFHILLPMTRLGQARRLAERLCHTLAASPLPELARPLTISAGVVEWRPRDSPKTLLKRVDELLYQAKAAGRNRVCSE